MAEKFRSYVQGIRDTARELGDEIPQGMEEGDSPSVNEDAGELDLLEYIRGQITGLIEHVKRTDRASARIANDVSCRANGIIPD